MVKQREKKNLFLTDTPWQIDKEWAESFVGMRMKVRDDYWSGGGIRSKTKFWDGRINSFDRGQGKWCVLFDDVLEEEIYLRWDAVLKYSDRGSSTFRNFPSMPSHPVADDSEEPISYQGKVYKKTNVDDRIQYLGDDLRASIGLDPAPRRIDPIPFYNPDKEIASVNITKEELELLKDVDGRIRYEKVFHWCLPKFNASEGDAINDDTGDTSTNTTATSKH